MTELDALLILNAIPNCTNFRIRKLIEKFGSACKVLSLKENDVSDQNIDFRDVIQIISNFDKDTFLKNEYLQISKEDVKIYSCWDNDYPENLREIADSPTIIYVKGEISYDCNLSLAIVGSRKASFYGTNISEQFSQRFSELGFTIVSGMARGIDTAAHKGSLKSGGNTIAVLGSGLSNIYPLENKELFYRIASNGAVISEFPMNNSPIGYNFPRRNRIISGLSMGVIVVEAALKSGALITADFALEQGREVYAVPGKVDSISSKGVNNLIKQGAKLVTCAEDVIEDLQLQLKDSLNENRIVKKETLRDNIIKDLLSEKEESVYNFISERPIHIDELIERSGSSSSIILPILLQLELKRLIKQLPGKMYIFNYNI